jgi:hypothetical protein
LLEIFQYLFRVPNPGIIKSLFEGWMAPREESFQIRTAVRAPGGGVSAVVQKNQREVTALSLQQVRGPVCEPAQFGERGCIVPQELALKSPGSRGASNTIQRGEL